MKIPKEGETVEVEGWGKGVVTGRPSPDGRYRVRLEDGRSVGMGGTAPTTGNPKTDAAIQTAVDQALASRGIVREPGYAGEPAVKPGDNNAGDPLFRADVDQPLKEQPLGPESAAPGETPEEVAEEDDVRTKAVAGTQRPPETRDKAIRGPRDR